MSVHSIGGNRLEDACGYLAEAVDTADGVLVVAFQEGNTSWRYYGKATLGAIALFLIQASAQLAREAEEQP